MAERNTFEGQRCIHSALNLRIRNLLVSYDYSKSTDFLQSWSSHILSLLTKDKPKTSNITLVSDTTSFQLHKALLAARSSYFQKKFAENPGIDVWRLSDAFPAEVVHSFQIAKPLGWPVFDEMPAEAVHGVLRYLYLGDLPLDLVKPRGHHGWDVIRCMEQLGQLFEVRRSLTRYLAKDEVEKARRQVEGFYRTSVLRYKKVVDTREVDGVRWPHSNAALADFLLRADEVDHEDDFGEATLASDAAADGKSNSIPIGPRGAFAHGNEGQRPKRSVIYPVHKSFLIRSPYFHTMFSGQFLEAQESEFLRMVKVDCSPEVLELILNFLYTEKAECPLDLALELLYTADMLFLDKLKAKAAATISTLGGGSNYTRVARNSPKAQDNPQAEVEVEVINVYDVIRAGWDLKVRRLEEFAARYIADRLEDYIDDPDFAIFIKESASRIKNRQETDTIELLDDIRHYLDERFRLRFEGAGIELLDGDRDTTAEAAGAVVQDGQTDVKAEENVQRDAGKDVVVDDETVMTLDGEIVEDEFDLEAVNYRILLRKIDTLLQGLNLDA